MGKYKTAVYIGRFQPFHIAHLETIRKALTIADKVIIAVGSCNKPNTTINPWDAEQRIQMIKNAIEHDRRGPWQDYKQDILDHEVEFITIRDYIYNNYKWAAEVLTKAMEVGATEDKDTVLIGCYKDDSSYYLKMFPQWSLEIVDYMYNLDATDIRTAMFENKSGWDRLVPAPLDEELKLWTATEDFTNLKDSYEHIVAYPDKWGYGPFVTVDAVTVKAGHILLVERGRNPGKGLWALPGGFIDANETIKQAAVRELKEETKIKVDKAVLYDAVKTVKPFDHPKRDPRGRIITHAHLIDLGQTGTLPSVKGADDAAKAFWVSFADIMQAERKFYSDHFDIIVNLTSIF